MSRSEDNGERRRFQDSFHGRAKRAGLAAVLTVAGAITSLAAVHTYSPWTIRADIDAASASIKDNQEAIRANQRAIQALTVTLTEALTELKAARRDLDGLEEDVRENRRQITRRRGE